MNSFEEKKIPFYNTKIEKPFLNRNFLKRNFLLKKLKENKEKKIIYFFAPGGFGKTTTILEFIEEENITNNIIWLSLDEYDNNTQIFFSYLIKSFDFNLKESCDFSKLNDIYEIQYYLSILANKINSLNNKLYLVIDDFHLITNKDILKNLAIFIKNLNKNVTFILSGRNKKNEYFLEFDFNFNTFEINAKDLLFTKQEIKDYFSNNNFFLSEKDLEILLNKTEGWILSLKASLLNLNNNVSLNDLINNIENDYLHTFLIKKILSSLDPNLFDFILKTSIMNYFDSDMANKLLNINNSHCFLDQIQEKQLFISKINNECYFKYHSIFSEILVNKLKFENLNVYIDLCKKVSILHKNNNNYEESINYALLTKDSVFIANILEELASSFIENNLFLKLEELIKSLPNDILFSKLKLLSYYAFLLSISYDLDYSMDILKFFDKKNNLSEDIKVFNIFTSLVLYIKKKYHIEKIKKCINSVIKKIHILDEKILIIVYFYLSRASYYCYDFEKSLFLINEAILYSKKLNNISFIISCNEAKALILFLQSNLFESENILNHILNDCKNYNLLEHKSILGVYIRFMRIYSKQYKIDLFNEYKNKVLNLTEKESSLNNKFLSYYILASSYLTIGDIDSLEETIDKIEKLDFTLSFRLNNTFLTDDINDLKIHILISRKQLDLIPKNWEISIKEYINSIFLEKIKKTRYIESLHSKIILLTRFYLANKNFMDALKLLLSYDNFLDDIFISNKIELYILEALIYKNQNKINLSIEKIKKSLILAEKSKYISFFIKYGNDIRNILLLICNDYNKRNINIYNTFLYEVLENFNKKLGFSLKKSTLKNNFNPLSKKEIEILNLMKKNIKTKDILNTLDISLNTFKTHSKSIYKKLNVNKKSLALEKATKLEFI
ncbi:MAG: LuxR C-terminal-related transcriptional regulator [Candidatus Sericytochromatia bacterium]